MHGTCDSARTNLGALWSKFCMCLKEMDGQPWFKPSWSSTLYECLVCCPNAMLKRDTVLLVTDSLCIKPTQWFGSREFMWVTSLTVHHYWLVTRANLWAIVCLNSLTRTHSCCWIRMWWSCWNHCRQLAQNQVDVLHQHLWNQELGKLKCYHNTLQTRVYCQLQTM